MWKSQHERGERAKSVAISVFEKIGRALVSIGKFIAGIINRNV